MSSNATTFIGLVAYLVMISIGLVTTNVLSRSFVVPIRVVGVVMAVCFAVISVASQKNKKIVLIGLIIYWNLLCFGSFLSLGSNSFAVVQDVFIVDSVVTSIGIVVISLSLQTRVFDGVALAYVYYGLLGIAITLLCRGIVLDVPPRFLFEYSKDGLDGNSALYSQGVSRFYGYCAVAVAYLTKRGNSKIHRIGLSILLWTFLGLSFLGGGRGDSFAALVIVLIYFLLVKTVIKINLVGLVVLIIGIIWYNGSEFVGELIFIQRFGVFIGGDYGDRDLLLRQVTDLIIGIPNIWILGSGFGFFQNFYNYEFGMYPHNAVAEALIVFGVLPAFMLIGLVLYGVRCYVKTQNSVDLFLLFYIYSSLIEMKSGYLFGGWFFTSASIVLVAFALFGRNRSKLKTKELKTLQMSK